MADNTKESNPSDIDEVIREDISKKLGELSNYAYPDWMLNDIATIVKSYLTTK